MIASIYMTFLAVAETGSFSKAAGKLFVSPVAVMNQMNELEGEVKAVLFVRTNRGVSLTRAGQMLQTKLLAIKKQTDQAMAEVRAISAKDKVRIRVGASMMRPATLLTALWQDSELLQRNFSLQIIPFDDNQFNAKWLSSVLGTEFDCITSPYGRKIQTGGSLFPSFEPEGNPDTCRPFPPHHPNPAKGITCGGQTLQIHRENLSKHSYGTSDSFLYGEHLYGTSA